MQTVLVGATDFAGGNLAASYPFDGAYAADEVSQAYGAQPELLVYAALPLRDARVQAGDALCARAMADIKKIAPHRLVLLSSADVYAVPQGVDENTPADAGSDPARAGDSCAALEQAVRAAYPDALFVRLPSLFGAGLEEGFLYEFIVRTAKDTAAFARPDLGVLANTDSRTLFQYYDLRWLWKDISWALAARLTVLNMATEPLSAAEIVRELTHGGVFANELGAPPARCDLLSKYDALYESENGYLYNREEVLEALRAFVFAARRDYAARLDSPRA